MRRRLEQGEARGPSDQPIRVLVAGRPGLWSEVLARRLAHEAGLTVVGRAHDADQLLVLAAEAQPDVVALDLVAVGGDCGPLMDRLRGRAPDARVLVLVAGPSEETELALLRAGAAGLVQSGAGFEALLAAIRAVAAGDLWAHRRMISRALELVQQARCAAEPTAALSRREDEIVGAVCRGLRNREIADALGIREKTVKRHLSNIFAKTGAADRSELIRLMPARSRGTRPTV